MITLQNLTIDDVNLILAGLSELPTKSGAYPVAMNIKAQAEPQIAIKENEDAGKVDSEGGQ